MRRLAKTGRHLAVIVFVDPESKSVKVRRSVVNPKINQIVEAIGEIDLTNKNHTIASGAPSVDVLSGLIGEEVNAEERDQAWDIFQQQTKGQTKDVVDEKIEQPAVTGQDALKHLRSKGVKI